MCALFIGRRNSHQPLEEAKHAFHHHYFVVTPYNKTHELAYMKANLLQLQMVTEQVINPSDQQETAMPSAEILALLEEKCHNDILFYQYMMSHYQEKLDWAKKHLNTHFKTPCSIV